MTSGCHIKVLVKSERLSGFFFFFFFRNFFKLSSRGAPLAGPRTANCYTSARTVYAGPVSVRRRHLGILLSRFLPIGGPTSTLLRTLSRSFASPRSLAYSRSISDTLQGLLAANIYGHFGLLPFAVRDSSSSRSSVLSDLPTTTAGTVSRLYSKNISRNQPAGSAFLWNSTMEDDFDEWFCGGDRGDHFVDDGYDFKDSLAFFSLTEEVTIAAWDAIDAK